MSEIPPPAAHRVGLLCNPLSGRLVNRPALIRTLAAAVQGCTYHEVRDAAGIESAVRTLTREGADTLIVAAGDGTLHGVLSIICRTAAFARPPRIAIVPCGTTNMSARDLGVQGSPPRIMHRITEMLNSGSAEAAEVERPALRVQQPDGTLLCGMFFGAGIIAAGVRYVSDKGRRFGWTGESAMAPVVARFLGALLAGRDDAALGPVAARVEAGDFAAGSADYLAILATTLHRLLLGMRPYWGPENEPVHVTLVHRNPAHLWRALPRLLTGRGGLAEADGYVSRNAAAVVLSMAGEFVLDGQLYSVREEDGPLRLSATAPIRFLCPRKI